MLCLTARYNDETLRFPIPKTAATIGSSPESEILLPFPGVSRTHAHVSRSSKGVKLVDAGSKNLIIVDGEKVKEAELTPGSSVQIGRVLLSLEDTDSSDVELALTFPSRNPGAARTSDTGSAVESDSAVRSPLSALRVVREIEMAGDRKVHRHPQAFLGGVRGVLDAASLLLGVTEPGGEIAIAAADGPIPSQPLLDGIALWLSTRRQKGAAVLSRTVEQTRVVVSLGGGRGRAKCLIALFGNPSGTLQAWEIDFLDYVSQKFLHPSHEETGDETEIVAEDNVLAFPPGMVVGESPAMHRLLSQIRATVRSRMDVLLLGETGTGKELFARMIHASGATAGGPFVAINCAAIPSELLESELFGVVGRVATGVDPRPGLFLQANEGSIFLDEIGELAEPLQAKLLRVLQEREVLPLGASSPKKINVRVIAASNRNLFERTTQGKFRSDLYYRLRGLQFHIPPLRERREDIPPLVLAFVQRGAEHYNRNVRGVSRRALDLLTQHDWPGNVRELQSEVERAVLVCNDGGFLSSEHFGPIRWAVETRRHDQSREDHSAAAAGPPPDPPGDGGDGPATLQERIDHLEREAIMQALRVSRGNKTAAARALGVTRNGLAMKMARLKIDSQ